MVSPGYLEFSFPPRWHYDVLRALDYFRAAGGAPDERMADAVELVRSKQQPDGTWLLEHTHPGAVHFALEDGDGRPSRWNTLRALRVLRWYDRSAAEPHSSEPKSSISSGSRPALPRDRMAARLASAPAGRRARGQPRWSIRRW